MRSCALLPQHSNTLTNIQQNDTKLTSDLQLQGNLSEYGSSSSFFFWNRVGEYGLRSSSFKVKYSYIECVYTTIG